MAKVMSVCPKCGNGFQLGVNGGYNSSTRRDECDDCANIKRDRWGCICVKSDQLQHYDAGDSCSEKLNCR